MLKSKVLEWAERKLDDAKSSCEWAKTQKALMISEGETLPIKIDFYIHEIEYWETVIEALKEMEEKNNAEA